MCGVHDGPTVGLRSESIFIPSTIHINMPVKKGRIKLWDLGSGLELDHVCAYLQETFPKLGCASPGPLVPPDRVLHFSKGLMSIRIPNLKRQELAGRKHTRKELNSVARIVRGDASKDDILRNHFSGPSLQHALGSRIGADRFSDINIVLTSALASTWDRADDRYRPRTVVCGFPSIVSTSGAVEGPDKPRGYQVARMMGLSDDEAKRKYSGRFLEHGDERLTEVVMGLAAQAVFYDLTGEPFCEAENCRLFNARWQEQLVKAHLEHGGICDHHFRKLGIR